MTRQSFNVFEQEVCGLNGLMLRNFALKVVIMALSARTSQPRHLHYTVTRRIDRREGNRPVGRRARQIE